MHQYSTDVRRWRFIAGIGAAALLFTILINPAIEQYLPDFLGDGASLTVLTLAGIFYYTYKYLLWLPVGWLFDSQLPNINGEWLLENDSAGVLSDNEDDTDSKKLVINQNWMEMQADYYNENRTYLKSDSGKVSTSGSNNPELILTCTGETPVEDHHDYNNVEGTFRLRMIQNSDEEKLIGRYYSNKTDNASTMVEFRLKSRRLIQLRTTSK